MIVFYHFGFVRDWNLRRDGRLFSSFFFISCTLTNYRAKVHVRISARLTSNHTCLLWKTWKLQIFPRYVPWSSYSHLLPCSNCQHVGFHLSFVAALSLSHWHWHYTRVERFNTFCKWKSVVLISVMHVQWSCCATQLHSIHLYKFDNSDNDTKSKKKHRSDIKITNGLKLWFLCVTGKCFIFSPVDVRTWDSSYFMKSLFKTDVLFVLVWHWLLMMWHNCHFHHECQSSFNCNTCRCVRFS